MMKPDHDIAFSELFDRAITACAYAQRLSICCGDAVRRARATRASSVTLRSAVSETREAWSNADSSFFAMHTQVTSMARQLRRGGMDRDEASAVVRSRVRFVLYDGGLGEREAEPVVDRATSWVDEVYAAA